MRRKVSILLVFILRIANIVAPVTASEPKVTYLYTFGDSSIDIGRARELTTAAPNRVEHGSRICKSSPTITEADEQLHSLKSQIQHATKTIKGNPKWGRQTTSCLLCFLYVM